MQNQGRLVKPDTLTHTMMNFTKYLDLMISRTMQLLSAYLSPCHRRHDRDIRGCAVPHSVLARQKVDTVQQRCGRFLELRHQMSKWFQDKTQRMDLQLWQALI